MGISVSPKHIGKQSVSPKIVGLRPRLVTQNLLAPFAGEHDVNRLENDHGVQLERVVPYIIKIVLQLLDRVFLALTIRIIHLRPASNSRFNEMSEMIEGYSFLITFSAFNPLRPRAD